MARWLPLCLLAAIVAASGASAEGVWLRGSGERVWVDRGDGKPPPPKPVEREAPASEKPAAERKGFTRVATSPVPSINRAYSEEAGKGESHHHHHHADCGHDYWPGHYYTPYVYVPGYSYRPTGWRYDPGSYRDYRPRYRYSDGTYYRPRHHRSSYGADNRYGSSSSGGHVLRGGAYRR